MGRTGRGNARMGTPKVIFILALALGLAVGVYVLSGLLEEPPLPKVRGVVETEAPVAWQGADYVKKKRVTTMLFMGVDRREQDADVAIFARNGGQADFLFLLVIDDESDMVYPLHIDRDTMTDIAITTIMGRPAGTRNAQICLSYGFGTTPAQSCELTREAVSGLLNGQGIDHYMSMNMGSIGDLNDAAGGVTVQMAEDLTVLNPAWTTGATVTLHGYEAEEFVRARMSVGAGTNVERMARQRAYLTGFREALLMGMKTNGESYLQSLFKVIDAAAETDVSDQWLLDELWKARDYQWQEIMTLDGEHAIGANGFMECHVDPQSIEEVIMRLYYKQQGTDA